MKRIMVVTNSLSGGGAERSMNLVCNELTRQGWSIALVPINSSETDLVQPICEIFPLNRQWRGSVFNTISSIVKFNRIVQSWNPELLILNCDLPELFGSLMPGRRKIVVIEHAPYPWANRRKIGRMVRKILKARNALWVAVSPHIKVWPNDEVPNAIIQNTLTPVNLPPLATNSDNQIRRIVYIGRLSPEKRPDWVIEIGRQSGFGAELIGDGPLRNSLQSRSREMRQDVVLSGYVQNPWSHIRVGDLLIVPSSWEGDGLVIIEGLRMNVPMLVADIPDFRRFELPENNYCRGIGDFVKSIDRYRQDLSLLVVPEKVRNSILASRAPEVVGRDWERFLAEIGFSK